MIETFDLVVEEGANETLIRLKEHHDRKVIHDILKSIWIVRCLGGARGWVFFIFNIDQIC